MDTVKDFFESLYDNYRDRVKSPFIGSLILSYLAFNWRTVAILLFSEWPMHYRIDWIEQKYCNWYNYVVPFLMSLFYILLLPHINLGIEWLLKGYTKKKQAKIDDLETARLNKRKANAKILREIAEEKAGTSEINTLKERNEGLQLENTNLTNQNQEDLQRYNTTLEQFRSKENDYKIQLQELTVQTDILWGKRKFTESNDVTLNELNEVISLSGALTELERINFSHLVQSIYNGKNVSDIQNVMNYGSLGLVLISKSKNGQNQYVVTKLGSLLYDYLKNAMNLNLTAKAS